MNHRYRSQFSFVLVLATLLVNAVQARAELSITYAPLNVPNAIETRPMGIDGHRVVGMFTGELDSGVFVYNGTDWTTPRHPVADGGNTFLSGVSGQNAVGWYWDEVANRNRAIHYDGTVWTTVESPGFSPDWASDIDGSTIVGQLHNSNSGFSFDGTNWTLLDFPGATGTFPNAIDGANIVGNYFDSGVHRGFLYDGITWSTIDYPGASGTNVTGIDGKHIVGNYTMGAGVDVEQYGFFYDGTTWTHLAYPNDRQMNVQGISGNTIIGSYGIIEDVDGNGDVYFERGFTATFTVVPEPTSASTYSLLLVWAFAQRRRLYANGSFGGKN
jgi:hypothetical protein